MKSPVELNGLLLKLFYVTWFDERRQWRRHWKVVNEIASSKEIRIKNNTQEWFDREIAELIHAQEKLFLKFKKSKLHNDEKITKKFSIKFKILLGKRKESSMKLILDKK